MKDAKVIFSNSHQKFGTTFLAVSDSGYNDPLLLLLLFNLAIIHM